MTTRRERRLKARKTARRHFLIGSLLVTVGVSLVIGADKAGTPTVPTTTSTTDTRPRVDTNTAQELATCQASGAVDCHVETDNVLRVYGHNPPPPIDNEPALPETVTPTTTTVPELLPTVHGGPCTAHAADPFSEDCKTNP